MPTFSRRQLFSRIRICNWKSWSLTIGLQYCIQFIDNYRSYHISTVGLPSIYRQLEILEYIDSGSFNTLSLDQHGCIQFIDNYRSYNIIMPVNQHGCIQFIDNSKSDNIIMPVNQHGCIQFIDN